MMTKKEQLNRVIGNLLIRKVSRKPDGAALDKYCSDYNEAIDTAVCALREAIEREENEPLTWKELKQMRGMPVWTQGVSFVVNGNWGTWDVVEEVTDESATFGYSTETAPAWSYNLRNADGTLCGSGWLAYRWEPKEGEANEVQGL